MVTPPLFTDDQLIQMFNFAQGVFTDTASSNSDKLLAATSMVVLQLIRSYRDGVSNGSTKSLHGPS